MGTREILVLDTLLDCFCCPDLSQEGVPDSAFQDWVCSIFYVWADVTLLGCAREGAGFMLSSVINPNVSMNLLTNEGNWAL